MEAKQPTVLVVDDTPQNITLIGRLLTGRYRVKTAISGEKALQIVWANDPPEVILLDVMMPEMDGYEVCRRLKADPRSADIPVIFLTARTDEDDERRGLEVGAADYVTKPVRAAILELRIANQLLIRQARRQMQDRNALLEAEVARRVKELGLVQDATIQAMAAIAESRDDDTGKHIQRTSRYVRLLADWLRNHGRHLDLLVDDATIELIEKSASLHDVGKVGIPDAILLKPGKLTVEEFEVIKSHVDIGRRAIETAARILGSPSSFLRFAHEITYSHHEKWNGSGYPQGLAGEAIPLAARIMAVADVYDALTTARPYKAAFSHERAIQIIREGRGTHFDPELVDTFLLLEQEFLAVSVALHDPN